MTAIALALGASLALGLSDFLAGVQTRELAVVWVLLVSQATGLVLVIVAAVAWGEPLPDLHAIGWAAGVSAASSSTGVRLFAASVRPVIVLVSPGPWWTLHAASRPLTRA